jgi:SAM-dependent methyltransferase
MATVGFCDVMTAERDYHDEFYAGRGRMPFNAGSYAFTDEDVRRWCGDIWQDGAHFRGTRTKRMLDLLETDRVAGRRVLDLGCGNGQYAVLLAKRGAFAYGCDISPIGVGIAREIATANGVADRCQFIVADATDLPWPSGAFDIVCSTPRCTIS